jgi:hypothetical protein
MKTRLLIGLLLCLSFFSQAAWAEVPLKAAPTDDELCTTVPGVPRTPIESAACSDDACKAASATFCSRLPAPVAGAPAAAPLPPPPVSTLSWQGALVNGLGNLMADRAKAEVEAWFEDLVRDQLCKLKRKPKNPSDRSDRRWFPETCKLIEDKRGASQQLATSMLAEAMKSDFKHLVTVVEDHVRAEQPAAVEALSLVPVAVAAFYEFATSSSPLYRLRDLAANQWVRNECAKSAGATEMAPACAFVFAGLAIDYYGPVLKMATNGKLDVEKAKDLLQRVFAKGQFHCDVIVAMTGKQCTDTTAVLPGPITTFFQVADGVNPILLEHLYALLQDMIDINELINKAQPNQGPVDARALVAKLDELLSHVEKLLGDNPPNQIAAVRLLLKASLAIEARDYSSAALALVEAVRLFDVALPEWAARFLPMVVDLAEAKDSAQVAAALTRAAAPVGSWRLKRQKRLWSISGLVGGSVGYEQPREDEAPGGQSFEGGWAAGLMAPVGLQFSWPCCKNGWSTGLLLSVLDVGQITWSRLEEKEASTDDAGMEAVPDTSLSKVFSPGLYLTMGAGHSPLTFGVGASYAPGLRAYTYALDGAEREQEVSVFRFGIFAAVDITLLPF